MTEDPLGEVHDMTAEYNLIAAMRGIARKEIASMAGLILKRAQEEHPTRSFERNACQDTVNDTLSRIFGEILSGGYGEAE